jgi:hypothetical protein
MRLTLLLTALLVPTASAQWEIQPSPTTASLRGIHALGNGIAWASGTSGTVLHTSDDGKTWQLCPTPPNAEKLDFRGVQAFDASTAIVMSSGKGDLSRLYKTTDACHTWTLLFTNPDPEGFWDGVSAVAEGGWILGDPVKGQFTVMSYSLNPRLSVVRPTQDDCYRGRGDTPVYLGKLSRDCAPGLAADPKVSGAFAASNSSFFDLKHAFKNYYGAPPISDEDAKPQNVNDNPAWIVRGDCARNSVCPSADRNG